MTRPLNILHIYRRFHPDYTGDGIYYTRLAKRLSEQGIGGEFLAFETSSPNGQASAVHAGHDVHYLRDCGLPATTPGLLRWLVANLGRFDLVHLHSHIDRYFLGYALARLAGRPVFYSCTLDDSPTQLITDYRPAFRPMARLLMRSIGTFVAISPDLLRRSLETVSPRRVAFVPQGVALHDAPPGVSGRTAARHALGLAQDDFVLLNVGSVMPRKNQLFLVDALARLRLPRARLVIVGPEIEPDYAQAVRAQVRAQGLEGQVLLAGYQEEAGRYYAAADALVFASTSEGFPNVFLEAMAAACPIVTRHLPGLTDFVVDHGGSGFIANDAAAFAEALAELAHDPARAAAMGRSGRAFAEANLDLDVVAARYARLYREACGDKPAPEPPPRLNVRGVRALSGGPPALGLRPVAQPATAEPWLQVVIDTEASFDWQEGIATDRGEISSIEGLARHIGLFQRFGIRPTLVLDHPVATTPESAEIIRALHADGCDIGVHLHPWTTPPVVEPKDDWHSFEGNLGPPLEARKIALLAEAVARLTGERPSIFKAGRYGLGPDTVETLRRLGFETDLSLCPSYDYSAMGGPDFRRYDPRPAWYGDTGGVLALPTTAAWQGLLHGAAARLLPASDSRLGRRLRVSRALRRANLLYPQRLSPEGNDLPGLCRLVRDLLAQGVRDFTLSLHSPTLTPGHTPYTPDEAALGRLLAVTERFLAAFRDEFAGRFVTTTEMRARLLRADTGGARTLVAELEGAPP